MNLKRFESFYIDDATIVTQLIQADVISRGVANSSDFINKLNSKREATVIDYFLPFVNDFNQHKDLDFNDFWDKRKNQYSIPTKFKNLSAEKALKKFFILGEDKLRFNKIVKKSFFDAVGIPDLPKHRKDGIVLPDNSRDGSIVTGPDKDNVKFVTKKITQHQNRKMY